MFKPEDLKATSFKTKMEQNWQSRTGHLKICLY